MKFPTNPKLKMNLQLNKTLYISFLQRTFPTPTFAVLYRNGVEVNDIGGCDVRLNGPGYPPPLTYPLSHHSLLLTPSLHTPLALQRRKPGPG